jgi:hypothetical protein
MKSNGANDKTTKDNFQPLINPIMIPLKKVDVNCKELANLSDRPSLILSTSLKVKIKKHMIIFFLK